MNKEKKRIFFEKKKPRPEELERILNDIGTEVDKALKEEKISSADFIMILEYDEENSYLKTKMDIEVIKRTSGYFGPEEEAAKIIDRARKKLEESLNELYSKETDTPPAQ